MSAAQVRKYVSNRLRYSHSQHHAGLLGVLGDRAHAFDAPLPFVLRRALAAEEADGGMVRTADRCRAEFVAAVERSLGGFDAGGANLGIGRDRVIGVGANRDGGALEAEVVEPLGPRLEAGRVAAEDRDFDAVVADLLELLEDGQHAVVEFAGPQQQVHSEFHRFCPQIVI